MVGEGLHEQGQAGDGYLSQCGRKNEAARYGDRRTAKEALMVVSEQVHDVDYYVHVLRRDISFLRTLSFTLSSSISFYFSVGSVPPQCKQHEVRDGCDKSAEDPDAEGLRKAAADATGAFAAATTQCGSGGTRGWRGAPKPEPPHRESLASERSGRRGS